MKLDLSDRFLKTIKAEKTTPFFDSKVPGLHIIVSRTGAKSWSLIYTTPGSDKRARLSLGTYPATSLATARTRAVEARGKVEQGEDPRPAKDGPAPAANTVAWLVESYLSKHGKGLKSGEALAYRLRRDVVPIIGDVKLDALHRRDVHRVLDAIKDRGSPQSAAKRHADLRAMFRWALDRGDLDHDPLAGAKAPTASKPRERFLSADELRILWPALSDGLPGPIALTLKISLVTGQRIGEVVGMSEEEIDRKKAVWVIPAKRSKNAFEHAVPLSRLALDLVAEARAIGFFRFNTLRVSQCLVQRRDRLPVKGWNAHDLRRSCATHLVMLGVSPIVVGAVLNHRTATRGTVTLQHYVQYDYAKEKREALDLWADRLAAIVGGGAKVVPMRNRLQ
jgi:integrase